MPFSAHLQRFVLSGFSIAVATAMLACAGPIAHRQDWLRVETPNFAIYSSLSEAKSLELARDLERFRNMVQVATNAKRFEPRVVTKFFAFDGDRSFRDFAPHELTVGYFLPSSRANYVGLNAQVGIHGRRVIFHEYVHFLLATQATLDYPAWFEEGFAELLSTMSYFSGRMHMGRKPRHVARAWRRWGWMPLRKVLMTASPMTLNEADSVRFYSEAWALVHYLQYRRARSESFSSQLTKYLRAVESGATVPQAVQSAFGASMLDIERGLLRYINDREFEVLRFRADDIEPTETPRVRAVSSAEITTELAELSLQLGKVEQAANLYRLALEAEPGRRLAVAGLARIHGLLGEAAEVERLLPLIASGETQDPWVALDHGMAFHAMALHAPEEDALGWFERARREYQRTTELAPTLPAGWMGLGSLAMERSKHDSEAILEALAPLEKAYQLLPSDVDVRFELGRAYLANGRAKEAQPLLRSTVNAAHYASTRQEAQRLLEEAGGGEETEPEETPEKRMHRLVLENQQPYAALAGSQRINGEWVWGWAYQHTDLPKIGPAAIAACDRERDRVDADGPPCALYAVEDEVVWGLSEEEIQHITRSLY